MIDFRASALPLLASLALFGCGGYDDGSNTAKVLTRSGRHDTVLLECAGS